MWEVVYLAPNRSIAEMLKDLLEKNGIPAMLRSADIPHLGPMGKVDILTSKEQVEEAKALIESYINSL